MVVGATRCRHQCRWHGKVFFVECPQIGQPAVGLQFLGQLLAQKRHVARVFQVVLGADERAQTGGIQRWRKLNDGAVGVALLGCFKLGQQVVVEAAKEQQQHASNARQKEAFGPPRKNVGFVVSGHGRVGLRITKLALFTGKIPTESQR